MRSDTAGHQRRWESACGTYQDLRDLVALAQTGRVAANLTTYSFEPSLDALDDLQAGKITAAPSS